jgi:alanyl-tRNA synthetase
VDGARRQQIAIHHTATHILHTALRAALGSPAAQAGSLVTADWLRFDFSLHRPVTEEELARAEAMANALVRSNVTLRCYETAYEDRPAHCIADFAERYGARVRVVEIGDGAALCGGTHVRSTGEIGAIKILGETGIAAGVRRLEAVAGEAATVFFQRLHGQVRQIASALRCGVEDVVPATEAAGKTRDELARTIAQLRMAQCRAQAAELLRRAERLPDGGGAVVGEVAVGDHSDLRALAAQVIEQSAGGIALLVATLEGKRCFALATGDGGPSAKDLANRWLAKCGGRGGGGERLAAGNLPGEIPFAAVRDAFFDILREKYR